MSIKFIHWWISHFLLFISLKSCSHLFNHDTILSQNKTWDVNNQFNKKSVYILGTHYECFKDWKQSLPPTLHPIIDVWYWPLEQLTLRSMPGAGLPIDPGLFGIQWNDPACKTCDNESAILWNSRISRDLVLKSNNVHKTIINHSIQERF